MHNNTENPQTNTLPQFSGFLLRLALGIILIAHGYLKVFVFGIEGTVQFFESIGTNSFAAYLTIFGEFAGGFALLLGLYTRLVSLLSLPILIGAFFVHVGNGWVFNAPGGGYEYPLLLVILAIGVFGQGSGAFALKRLPVIDAFIPRFFKA